MASSDTELVARVTRALNFGFYATRDSTSQSTNGKMNEYHAAVGLPELDGWSAKRDAFQAVAARYRRQLAGEGLADRFLAAPDIGANYALFVCRSGEEAVRLQQCLCLRCVDFRLWYGTGLHRQTYFSPLPRDDLGITDSLAPRVLGLPMATDLTEAQIARVVSALAEGVAT